MALRVLLVGTGITSAVISALLKKSKAACQIYLWDKAKGAGGRMTTSRSVINSMCTADLGAQYITAVPKYLKSHADFYSILLKEKILEPLTSRVEGMKEFPEGTLHFVAPGGMNAIVKYFLTEGGYPTEFGSCVTSIDECNEKWVVQSQSGRKETYDVVVLTMPVPQIMQLDGDVLNTIDGNQDDSLSDKFEAVKYSSRYALVLFYDDDSVLPEQAWDAKYTWNHDTFRFVSFDNKKRQRSGLPTAVVFHTSIDFGKEHAESNIDGVQQLLLEKVSKLFPDWPAPVGIKCHKWKYSQVLEPYVGSPGCVMLNVSPLLVAAGDGFTHSNFDGCIESALATTKLLIEFITAKSI